MIKKKGSAQWKGGIKDGEGTISSESGVLRDAPYGFRARFEGGKGSNPEELLGAAHAACFSMALSKALGDAGITPVSIRTEAVVGMDKDDKGFKIVKVELTTRVKASGADAAAFQEVAESAKQNCPVSRLFDTEISLDASLE